jgi:uncharacterized SAM-binding protein YcdF (DUF218 family)
METAIVLMGCVVLLSASPLGYWALVWLENRFSLPANLPPHIEGIILLGGGLDLRATSIRGQAVYNAAFPQIIECAVLARKYGESTVVITGNPVEAEIISRVMIMYGVNSKRLIVDNKSKTTSENVINCCKMMLPKTDEWLLVTSAFHMPRSIGLFRAAGWGVLPYPVNYLTAGTYMPWLMEGAFNVIWWKVAARELCGLILNRVSGNSKELLPSPDCR